MTKRQQAEKRILDLITDLDPSGENTAVQKRILNSMSDKEFDQFMKNIIKDPYKYHLTVELNQSSKTHNGDKMIDINHLEKVAKKYNIKLREYVAFPHLNPKDPDNPFITPTPVPVLILLCRRLQQMVQKKNFAAGTVEQVNPILNQSTGDSKAASLGDSQTFSLTTTNQKDAIREFLTIRADSGKAKIKMLNQIEKTGNCSYKDCDVDLNDMQSVTTMKVFAKAAMLDIKSFNQKNPPVNRD